MVRRVRSVRRKEITIVLRTLLPCAAIVFAACADPVYHRVPGDNTIPTRPEDPREEPWTCASAPPDASVPVDAGGTPDRCGPNMGFSFETARNAWPQGWSTEGSAFACGPAPRTRLVGQRLATAAQLSRLTALGGDYWNVHWPQGDDAPDNHYFAGSGDRPDSSSPAPELTGALQSNVFVIGSTHLSYWIAGEPSSGTDADNGLELWTEMMAGEPVTVPTITVGGAVFVRRATTDSQGTSGFRHPAAGNSFVHVVLDVSAWHDQRALIRIVDASATASIAVDTIACTDDGTRRRSPVMGFVDTHSHPFQHQGFGGLQGIRTVWGQPGGSLDHYTAAAGPDAFARDFPSCDGAGHGGGPTAPLIIAGMNGDDPAAIAQTSNGHEVYDVHHEHPRPDFRRGAHQTMHITQMRRAFDGGLRLMTAMAVSNQAEEFLVSRLPTDHNAPRPILVPDRAVLLAFLCGIRQLADRNSSWMAIAYTPQQARDIIASDRLAVVLGIELDHAGEFHVGSDPHSYQDEIRWLLGHGFRQIIPIHASDNRLGGAACFQDLYNGAQDFYHRLELDERNASGSGSPADRFANTGEAAGTWDPPYFINVEDAACRTSWSPLTPWSDEVGNCVLYHFSPVQDRGGFGFLGQLQPWLTGAVVDAYAFRRTASSSQTANVGMINQKGLTADGQGYVDMLFQSGALVDIAHASDRSVSDILRRSHQFAGSHCGDIPSESSVHSHAMSNAPGDPWRNLSADCADHMPPVINSHTNFRAQSLGEHSIVSWSTALGPATPLLPLFHPVDDRTLVGTSQIDYVPSEFETSDIHAHVVDAIGGLLSPFVNQDPVDPARGRPWVPPAYLDLANCARSSGEHVLTYRYGLEILGLRTMGIATDFVLHPMTSPRFGEQACWTPDPVGHNSEQAHRPDAFRIERQGYGVRYDQNDPRVRTRVDQQAMSRYRMGAMAFDFNTDGLANYGLVPDQLQDEYNIGLGSAAAGALWSSAEAYIVMWEKAWRLGGCAGEPTHCGDSTAIPSTICVAACRGTCPDDGGFDESHLYVPSAPYRDFDDAVYE